MAQSVTVATPPHWNLEVFREIISNITGDYNAREYCSEHQFQVVAKDGRWYLTIDDLGMSSEAATEYANYEEMDIEFRRNATMFRYFSIVFNDLDITRSVIRALALVAVSSEEVVWLDTDYGWAIQARDVLERINLDARWDWRHPLRIDPRADPDQG